MAKNMMRYFTKEVIEMANKLMKQCPTSTATKKTQIKSTMSYHYVSPFTALHIFVLHGCCIFFFFNKLKKTVKQVYWHHSPNSIVF